jgi:hypothetical protein
MDTHWFKKNWTLPIGFILGIVVLGLLPYTYIIEPAMPKLIIDTDAPAQNTVGFLPVEMTGKNPSLGKVISVCSVPVAYLPFVHNRMEGEWDLLNPNSNLNLFLRYGSIAFLVAIIGFVAYRLVILRRRRIR